MNRLTEYSVIAGRKVGDLKVGEYELNAFHRLAKYEDTGLMPDEVEAMKVAMMGKTLAEVKEFCGIPIKQMVELAEAYRDGRCLCSKYPVGATVYRLNLEFEQETKFIGGERYFRYVQKWVVVKCKYTWADAENDSKNPGVRKIYLNEQDAIRERDALNRKEKKA